MTADNLRPILVLGGYGHFGSRVCRALALQPNAQVIVSGRHMAPAVTLINSLPRAPGATLTARLLDHQSKDFPREIAKLDPVVVVHAAGPFQDQNYHVAEACIAQGVHYVDLADGREFVTGITRLDQRARARGILVTAGASTLPALSAAVLSELTADMAQLERVEISIAPGQQTPRGLATLEGVLSYCGRGFFRLHNGRRTIQYGWQNLHSKRYPQLGRRWLANCDVPDLDLLPQQFPELRDVACYGALEVLPLAVSIWLLSWLSRWGLVDSWTPYAGLLSRGADLFDPFGSDVGGMQVVATGYDRNAQRCQKRWDLIAGQGHGPEIPATPAAIVATKLARGEILHTGAAPCTGLFSLNEFAAAVAHLDISWKSVDSPDIAAGKQPSARDSIRGKLYPLR